MNNNNPTHDSELENVNRNPQTNRNLRLIILMLAFIILFAISITCIIMALNASIGMLIQCILTVIGSIGFIMTGWLSCMLLTSKTAKNT